MRVSRKCACHRVRVRVRVVTLPQMNILRCAVLPLSCLFAACAATPPRAPLPPPTPVESFDAASVYGRWYVIAQTRAPGAGREVGVTLDIIDNAGDSGAVTLERRAQAQDFSRAVRSQRTRAHATETAAHWQLDSGALDSRTLSWLWLDGEGRYAALGDDARSSAWILARESRMPDERYEPALQALQDQGYPIERLRKFAHSGDQLDAPGYE